MRTNLNLNPMISAILNSLPGYFLSLADVSKRLVKSPSWLETIGKFIPVTESAIFVIPASELGNIPVEMIRQINDLPQLTKLVSSETGGVLITFTGPVSDTWLDLFSKIDLSKVILEDGHYVRASDPGYTGPVMSYHLIRTENDELLVKSFSSVNGLPIQDVDFLSFEGENYLAATTLSTPENVKRTVFTREVPVKAITRRESVSIGWTPAPWAEGHNVIGLRGEIKDGEIGYSFRCTDKDELRTASPDSKSSKVRLEGVKGVLVNVTGATQLHGTTVVTDDKVIAVDTFSKDDRVIMDLSRPEYSEIARYLKENSSLFGVLGLNTLFLQGNTPFANLVIADRPMTPAISAVS